MRRNVECHAWFGMSLQNMGSELRSCYVPMLQHLRRLWNKPIDIAWDTISTLLLLQTQLLASISGDAQDCPCVTEVTIQQGLKLVELISIRMGKEPTGNNCM
jgi:hypothetical protein